MHFGGRKASPAEADNAMRSPVIMILAIAVLPFAVRNQDVVRAIAHMCGFDFG